MSRVAGRRVQRSARVVVAISFVALAVVAVSAAVASGVAVPVAAVVAAVSGGLAVKIVHRELRETRSAAAHDRAEQARGFGAAMTKVHREHLAFSTAMTARLAQRDRGITEREATIGRLEGTLRLADRRIDEAETQATRETHRADEAQARLSTLLDEVLTQPPLGAVEHDTDESAEMPTIVDLLAWEERVTQAAEASRHDLVHARLEA